MPELSKKWTVETKELLLKNFGGNADKMQVLTGILNKYASKKISFFSFFLRKKIEIYKDLTSLSGAFVFAVRIRKNNKITGHFIIKIDIKYEILKEYRKMNEYLIKRVYSYKNISDSDKGILPHEKIKKYIFLFSDYGIIEYPDLNFKDAENKNSGIRKLYTLSDYLKYLETGFNEWHIDAYKIKLYLTDFFNKYNLWVDKIEYYSPDEKINNLEFDNTDYNKILDILLNCFKTRYISEFGIEDAKNDNRIKNFEIKYFDVSFKRNETGIYYELKCYDTLKLETSESEQKYIFKMKGILPLLLNTSLKYGFEGIISGIFLRKFQVY